MSLQMYRLRIILNDNQLFNRLTNLITSKTLFKNIIKYNIITFLFLLQETLFQYQ